MQVTPLQWSDKVLILRSINLDFHGQIESIRACSLQWSDKVLILKAINLDFHSQIKSIRACSDPTLKEIDAFSSTPAEYHTNWFSHQLFDVHRGVRSSSPTRSIWLQPNLIVKSIQLVAMLIWIIGPVLLCPLLLTTTS